MSNSSDSQGNRVKSSLTLLVAILITTACVSSCSLEIAGRYRKSFPPGSLKQLSKLRKSVRDRSLLGLSLGTVRVRVVNCELVYVMSSCDVHGMFSGAQRRLDQYNREESQVTEVKDRSRSFIQRR